MRNSFFKLGPLTVTLLAISQTHAQTLSFADVWSKVRQSSLALEAAQLSQEGAEISERRAARHWLPRLYLEARSYRTNDPGSAFFGVLEQREVRNADFAPDQLNHRKAQTFTRGSLGLDLALYEGGLKDAQATMAHHLSEASHYSGQQLLLAQYSQSGQAFGTIALLRRQMAKLSTLSTELNQLMKSYQLGQKSNPVGYSGLLGMKSVSNRVSGALEQMQAQEKAALAALREMGLENEKWTPLETDTRKFIAQYFSVSSGHDASFGTLAAKAHAEAAGAASKMERARYLPRVGAFGETYLFKGDRDQANGYSAGLYLQWNLFNPADYGSYKEAQLKALAASKQSLAEAQQENAERSALQAQMTALNANLLRLEESDQLLAEQTRVSSTLFKNGSIGALQFVEILNRRTDLISQQTDAEMALIATATNLTAKTQAGLATGAQNESK